MRTVNGADLAFVSCPPFGSRIGVEAETKEAMITKVLTTRVLLLQRLWSGFYSWTVLMIVYGRSIFIHALMLTICICDLSESKGSE